MAKVTNSIQHAIEHRGAECTIRHSLCKQIIDLEPETLRTEPNDMICTDDY